MATVIWTRFLPRQFDYPRFIQLYRRRCAVLGVDPASGASSYDLARLGAEQRKAAYEVDGWWRDYALWTNSAPYRSSTEENALRNVFDEAFTYAQQLVEAQRRAQQELAERWTRQEKAESLRELLARRGRRLTWVSLDDEASISVIVSLGEG